MKRTIKVGLSVGLIWIIFTMIMFYTGNGAATFKAGIFINVFCLLCAIAAGLYLHKKESGFEKATFPSDFKAAMQSGVIYAILVAGFIYLYHEKIDPSIREGIKGTWIEANENFVQNEEDYAQLQEDDPTWEDKTYDDYMENQEDQLDSIFSSSSIFIFHLAGLFFFSIFYSFFAVVILRKVVMRQ